MTAAVPQSILGWDFLAAHQFLIDTARSQLISLQGHSATDLQLPAATEIISTISASFKSKFESLLDDYPQLLKPNFHLKVMPHGVQLAINTKGPPLFCRPRRLAPEQLQAMETEFAAMEEAGIVRRSKSSWASPLHVVRKRDGGWRPCGDYRRLNMVTKPDRYAVPHLQDFTRILAGKKIFSKIDLVKSYHQIPVRQSDVGKTAVATPFGTYEYVRMPFGLRNAGQTFQRLLDTVTQGLPRIFCYIDDILVASESERQHETDLRALCERLQEHGLTVNREKSEFGVSELSFLGHKITTSGVEPLRDRVEAVGKRLKPETVKQLRSLLGYINFYHRFIPGCSRILQPLHSAVKGRPNSPVDWTEELEQAFEEAKNLLSKAAMLAYVRDDAQLILTTDASDTAAGAVLEQQVPAGGRQPLGYYSKLFSRSEKNYSTFDRELTAVYYAVRHFKHLLVGRNTRVLTDHKPLVSALLKTNDPISGRQQRQLSFISQYVSSIAHIDGEANVLADLLSRPQQPRCNTEEDLDEECVFAVDGGAVSLGLDWTEVARDQLTDPDCQALRKNPSLSVKTTRCRGGIKLLVDASVYPLRPLLPDRFRFQVFENLHNLAHPGPRATVKMVTQRVLWPSVKRDVTAWARACIRCQRAKVSRHTKAPLHRFDMAAERFAHIHVDFVGPLPEVRGKKYIVTMIDRFTRWPVAFPVSSTSFDDLYKAVVYGWIQHYGLPQHITSDRGSAFISDLWGKLAWCLGIKLHRTTAFHPQANGMLERWHRRLKDALVARLAGNSDWLSQLPWVMLGLRSAPVSDAQVSPVEMVYGAPVALPACMVPEDPGRQPSELAEYIRERLPGKPVPLSHHTIDRSFVPPKLATCSHVFVRNEAAQGLNPRYNGPFKVVERTDKTFLIRDRGSNKEVSIDRVRPAELGTYLDEEISTSSSDV